MVEGEIRPGSIDGHGSLTLASPDEIEATFVPGAGMVGCSLRDRGEELLGLRGGLPAWVAKGSSFGIPLLYPWANRLGGLSYEAAGREVKLPGEPGAIHLDANGLPMHGLLFAAPDWEVFEAGPARGGAKLAARLDFGADPERLEAFPFPHVLEVRVRLAGLRLDVATSVLAGPHGPVPVSFGWHPYLAPPGARRADWEISFPPTERLGVDGRQVPTGEREEAPVAPGPLGARTFDDGYGGVRPGTECSVSDGVRRISVSLDDGYPFAQVYAPADQQAVCFEPMTAPANALGSGYGLRLVEPGGSFTATFSIAVERL